MSHAPPEPADRPFRVAAFPAGVSEWSYPYFVLCHAALAKRSISVSDAYPPRGRVVVMHHGNLAGAYSQARARDEVFAEFALNTHRPLVSTSPSCECR
jgi:hypothetical protein